METGGQGRREGREVAAEGVGELQRGRGRGYGTQDTGVGGRSIWKGWEGKGKRRERGSQPNGVGDGKGMAKDVRGLSGGWGRRCGCRDWGVTKGEGKRIPDTGAGGGTSSWRGLGRERGTGRAAPGMGGSRAAAVGSWEGSGRRVPREPRAAATISAGEALRGRNGRAPLLWARRLRSSSTAGDIEAPCGGLDRTDGRLRVSICNDKVGGDEAAAAEGVSRRVVRSDERPG